MDREVVSLFLHFTVNPKPRVDFIDRPRCCLRGKECSINRFQQVESRWGYSGTSDRIRWAAGGAGRGPAGRGVGPGLAPLCAPLSTAQVLGQQAHLRGRLWALRLHPRAHGLPSEHPGARPVPGSLLTGRRPDSVRLGPPGPAWGPPGGPGEQRLLPPPQIIHTDSNTVLGQNDTGFSCDGSASTFRVMFKEPVEVLPSVNYTACATLKVGPALPQTPSAPRPPVAQTPPEGLPCPPP